MAVPLNFLLILTLIQGISGIITGYTLSVKAGASVSVPCLYRPEYRDHVKYLCKGHYWDSCKDVVKTNSYQSSAKFSISDEKNKKVFTVTINKLTDKNSGYWCAVEIDGGRDVGQYFYLSVTEGTPSLYVDNQEVTGYIGEDITINCNYRISGGIKWCKLGRTCVTEGSGSIDGTTVTINWSVDHAFSVTLSELSPESSGWYYCVRGDFQMPVHLSVIEKPEGIHSNNPISKLSVKTGASVSVPCLYRPEYRHHVKYLCEGYYWSSCSRTSETNKPQSSAKFSISDDKNQTVFTVTINELTDKNSDYWCAVEIDGQLDVAHDFHLSVTKDTPSLYVDNQEVTGYIGEDITINCHYRIPGRIKWCKLGRTCVTEGSGSIDGTTVTINWSVYHAFSVTLSELSPESSGWYYCVRGDFQMPVHLSVIKPEGIHSNNPICKLSVKTGASVSVPCLYRPEYRHHVKYLCEGYGWSSCSRTSETNKQQSSAKFSISDDKNQTVFTVTINELTDKNSDYWCAVEIDGQLDVAHDFHLSVTKDTPSLYVDNQEVTGYIGEDITINCNYRIYGGIKWCKLGRTCVTEGSGSIDGTTVTINWSVYHAFSVTLSELSPESSGWYYCVIGDFQMPVHLSVIEKPAAEVTPDPDSESREMTTVTHGRNRSEVSRNILIISLSLLLLIVLVALITWFLVKRKLAKGSPAKPEETEQEVTYTEVSFKNKKSYQGSVAESEENVTYSCVAVRK